MTFFLTSSDVSVDAIDESNRLSRQTRPFNHAPLPPTLSLSCLMEYLTWNTSLRFRRSRKEGPALVSGHHTRASFH